MKKLPKIITATLTLALLVTQSASATTTFTDVYEQTRFKDGILFAAAEGIVNGYPDQTFKPLQILNRVELMKVAAEGTAIYHNWSSTVFDSYHDDICFNDVNAYSWKTKYTCYGKAKAWVVGFDNGTYFDPGRDVTFTEALKIIFKAFEIPFTEGTPWYKNAVDIASEKGYIPETITGFKDPITRAEATEIITRIIKDERGELADYLGDSLEIKVTYETLEAGADLSDLELAP